MNWIVTALWWYMALFFLGIVFFPLTKRILGGFIFDAGYAASKIIGILILTYTAFVLGLLKIFPFTQLSLIILLGVFLIINLALFFQKLLPLPKNRNVEISTTQFLSMIITEILFVCAFYFWVLVRGQEPSLHGLEKFMDYGFMKSILRARYFPPLDMWLSADPQKPNGYFINYYYFGHLTGATLIRLTGVTASIGYNLILCSLFALGVTQVFSLVANIALSLLRKVAADISETKHYVTSVFFGLLGAFVINLGGNLHTIYLFTTGYATDKPVPFWQVWGGFHPEKYWYPNATRFIPYTIHEFPSYSYVVADLHGHVFDIPYVLLTIAFLTLLVLKHFQTDPTPHTTKKTKLPQTSFFLYGATAFFLGFMTAIHYMTNAFDGLIYLLLSSCVFTILYRVSKKTLIGIFIMGAGFVIFSKPFTANFQLFASKIGVNCSPPFLTNMGHFGPFLFEKGNCQSSPLWMLFTLWGFFWVSAGVLVTVLYLELRNLSDAEFEKRNTYQLDSFMAFLFLFGSFLIVIPEFFYAKDIYPMHFRANTMFKLGYQAFILMGIAATYTLLRVKVAYVHWMQKIPLQLMYLAVLFLVAIYPFYSIPSYYGHLTKPVELDGTAWLLASYPENVELLKYMNTAIKGQPVVLEAQGDSYTDFNHLSSYTGLPTVAGWWVHEWLWRGSSDVVGKRIGDIVAMYESQDIEQTKQLLKKYHVKYVVVSTLEKQKYTKLQENKFATIGKLVFKSTNGNAKLYLISGV